jgi:uncharacterized protein (DUF1330 family)
VKPYRVGVEATLQAFGGVRLASVPAPQAVEGEAPRGMVVLLRCPSLEAARAWHASPAYQALLPHRLASSSSRLHLIEGLPA